MLEHTVWELQYRPRRIADTILPEDVKERLQTCVNEGKVPNMLFSGSPGIGKTTVARAIADELGAELLYINASLEGNIDTIRTTVTQFVTTVSMDGSPKIVLLDEADYLSNSAQPSLRGFMDEFSGNSSFILTCNYPKRIIEPLISRLQVTNFAFNKENKVSAMKQMLKRAEFILTKEGVEFEKQAVATLIAKNFPDFRKTIGELQRFAVSGKIDSEILTLIETSNFDLLLEAVKEKNFTKCRQWVTNNPIDGASFYRDFYDKALPLLVPQCVPPVILVIAEYQYRSTASVDPEINAMAFLINFMGAVQFK